MSLWCSAPKHCHVARHSHPQAGISQEVPAQLFVQLQTSTKLPHFFPNFSVFSFNKESSWKITQKYLTFGKTSKAQYNYLMFTELVHVVPTLSDFLGLPKCEEGSGYMEEGKGENKLREGARNPPGNFTTYVCFKGKKGQIKVPKSN